MKESLALSILKIEGIGEHSTCHIILDDNLQSTVLIHDKKISENCVEFPLSGVLKLLVTSVQKRSSLKYYLALNIECLPFEGAIWLPLFSSFSEVPLSVIPSILPLTKVLISINSLSTLTPVPEITETDSSVFDLETSLIKKPLETSNLSTKPHFEAVLKSLYIVNEKNKELRGKICEIQAKYEALDQELAEERSKGLQDNQEFIAKLLTSVDKYKNHCEILQAIHEDHIKQINSIQIMLKQEILQREHLEKQLNRITNDFRDYAQLAEARFAGYEQSLKLKSEELDLLKQTQNLNFSLSSSLNPSEQVSFLQNQLHSTIEQLQESEFNRKVLQDKLESSNKSSQNIENFFKTFQSPVTSQHSQLVKELQVYRQKCAELENLLDDKYIKIKTQDLNSAQQEIKDLKDQLLNEKVINEQLMSQVRDKEMKEFKEIKDLKDLQGKSKGLDEKFVEYLKVYQVEDRFHKVAEGIFTYLGKKVQVAFKNGCLICKAGCGFVGVEKFLKAVRKEIDETATHKRSQTACFDDKSESKNLRTRISLGCKENFESTSQVKSVTSRVLTTKSMTPNRESVFKRVFK